MEFIVDTMLGKLARWLRILGYDAVYESTMTLKELAEMSNSTDTIFITRRKTLPDGLTIKNMLYVPGEKFEDHFRFIIKRFHLDTKEYLFTRCLHCNVEVKVVEKSVVVGKVPQQSFEGFQEFHECPKCHKIYWGGAHLRNTQKKLEQILIGKE